MTQMTHDKSGTELNQRPVRADIEAKLRDAMSDAKLLQLDLLAYLLEMALQELIESGDRSAVSNQTPGP
jgi:hypothetical protein